MAITSKNKTVKYKNPTLLYTLSIRYKTKTTKYSNQRSKDVQDIGGLLGLVCKKCGIAQLVITLGKK